jgi:DNA-binding SARP family transcriptional activator/tetratricopeptide (TPR) repeat protein
MLQSVQTIRINLFGRAHLSHETGPLKFNAPPRALSLLAYLLLNRTAPLSRDSVAFALWPDDGESDARSNLRRHLFYLLNDVLPPAAEGPWVLADKRTVQWNPVAPAWCDVSEFERLSANPARAAEAAALYGGDLMLGVDDEWLEAPRERLRERQIALLLALIAESKERSDLAAGIAYAKALLGIDPWREDAVRALIALRHAAGDRAGAMQAYRDFAKRLHEELGVAPMPETAALGERLSRAQTESVPVPPAPLEAVAAHGSAEGNGALQAAGAARTISNLQAIRATPSFTGRERELAALEQAFGGGSATAAIYGMGGIGKSALAREYARRSRERYALVWWLRAETEPELIDGLVQLGSTLVPNLEKAHDRRSAAEHVVSNVLGGFTKPILLVFDNLEHERLLRTWRPQGSAHALVTSRHAAWSSDVQAIGLDTWEADEAARYLRRESGRADLSEAEAHEMAEALGGLPLAFAHAAAYLRDTRTVTARRYLERINDHLAKAPKGAEYDRAVFATFTEAIVKAEEEAPGAASLLRLAAFFASDAIPEELFRQPADVYAEGLSAALPGAAASALDLRSTIEHEAAVDEGLGALHRFSLLAFSENRSYTLHRLVQSAGRRLLGSDGEEWARSAVAAVEAAFPVADFTNWAACERLAAHARTALAALEDGTAFAPAARLANRFGDYLRKRAAFGEAEALLARGLRIAERTFGPDDPETASSLDSLAGLLRDTNRHAAAEPLYQRALAISDAARDPADPHVARILNGLAILKHYSGRLAEAEPLFRRALTIDEGYFGPAHPTVAIRLNNLALLLHETDRLAEAEPMFRRALALDEASYGAEHPDVATGLCNLAWLLSATDRLREAEPLLQRALAIRERCYGTEHPSFAFALSDLAVLLHDGGRFADAERFCRQALAICETSYGPAHPIVAAHFNNLAELLADTNRHAEAETLYRRALAIDEASYGERHPNVARDLNNLAGLLYALERIPEAQACLERALAIALERFGEHHPRVEALRQNLTLLAHPPESGRRSVKRNVRWRTLRRSPSRGLRE